MTDSRTPKEKFQEHLIALVRLMYGLALATGTASSLKICFDEKFMGDLDTHIKLSAAAFFLGIADFIIYHYAVSEKGYKSVWRLVLDISFPTLIFVLFFKTQAEYEFSILLLLYMIFTFIYLLLLSIDGLTMPVWYWSAVGLLTITVGAVFVQLKWHCCETLDETTVFALLISCICYCVINLKLANGKLSDLG